MKFIFKKSTSSKRSLLVFLLIGLLIFIAMRILGFDGLYGQDAYEYASYTSVLRESLVAGGSVDAFFWPVIYPIACLIPDILVNNPSISMQLVSSIAWSGTIWAAFEILRNNQPEDNGRLPFFYALIFVGFSPYVFRLGFTGMSDMLCAFFVVNTFRYFLKEHFTNKLLFVVLFGSLAVFTRYGAVVLVLLPIVIVFYETIKLHKWTTVLFSLAILLCVAAPYIVLKGFDANDTLHKSVVNDWSILHWFQSDFVSNEGQFQYPTLNFVYAFYSFFHPAFFFIGLPLLVIGIVKKKLSNPWIWLSVILYCLFIAGIHFQNKRFLVLVVPLVVILLYPAFIEIWTYIKKWKWLSLLSFGFINLILTTFSFQKVYVVQKEDIAVYKMMASYNPKKVITFEMDVSLKGRGLKAEFENIWLNKLNSPDKGTHVLLNESKWKDQWSDHLVMKNCEDLHTIYQLQLLDSLPSGWKLYIIE